MPARRKSKFYRLVSRLEKALLRCGKGADMLVGTVLSKWCELSFPGLPKPRLPTHKALLEEPAVAELVKWMQDEDFLHATYWLSSVYALLSGETYRKKLAMFFTPPSLTKRLLDDLDAAGVDFGKRTFCDPACGGAAFLAPVAQRMRVALLAKGATAHQVLDHVTNHVYGTDMDRTLCELSRHFLMMVLRDEILATGKVPELRVARCDSLQGLEALYGTMDVLTCNPPYRKMAADEVTTYRAQFPEVIESQPNLYSLFIALCVKLMKPGGVCALVTPTSFLSGQYFSQLRTFLMHETEVLSIGMVSDRTGVFMDVEQETALTLLQRAAHDVPSCTSAKVSVVSRDGDYVSVGNCALPNSGAAWPIPRTETDLALLARATKLPYRLVDYGYVARTGSFVWNRDKRPTYISAAMATRNTDGSAVPLLWSSDIKLDGSLSFDGERKANKEPCFVALGSKFHPSVIRQPSLVLQRVTSNDQPRRLVAAAVPQHMLEKHGGFVGENHTVILVRQADQALLTPTQMAQLLRTPVVDRYFRCISGTTSVSLFELNQLVLPDPRRVATLLTHGLPMERAVELAYHTET